MTWNSIYPDGAKSVRQNVTPGQQNTTYTQTNMNKDHFWNIGTDEDGHHRAINMENYTDTAIGAPVDAPIATGMDGVFYLKQVNSRIQGFYRNSNGIYQFVPGFISGSASITSSYQNIVTVPDGSYGNIIFFTNDANQMTAFGSYKAAGGVCQAYCVPVFFGNSQTLALPFRFGNGDQASGLNLRVRTSDAATGTYQYRIQFWAI